MISMPNSKTFDRKDKVLLQLLLSCSGDEYVYLIQEGKILPPIFGWPPACGELLADCACNTIVLHFEKKTPFWPID